MPRFSTESTELIFGSLTNSSLQVALLWILASIALRFMSRSSAAIRHQLLVATLLCGMLVPFLNSFLTRQLFETNRLTTALKESRALSGTSGLEPELTLMQKYTKYTKNQTHDDVEAQIAKRKEVGSDTSATFDLKPQNAQGNNGTLLFDFISFRTYATNGLVWLWTIGMTVLSLRFLIAQWQLRKMEKQLHRHLDDRDLQFAQTKMKCTWFRSAPVVMCSASEHTPMTWGILHPKVLLPNSFSDWPASTRRAALLHEFAHIQRWDSAWQCLSRLFCVVFWFHPCAWWIRWQLNALCEKACDDQVLASGERASDYAAAILFVAKSTQCPLSATCIAMARKGMLSDRIEQLFDTRVSHSQSIRRTSFSISLLAVLVTFFTTLIQPCRGFALMEWLQQEPTDSPIALNSLGSVDALGDALVPGARLQFGTKRFRPPGNVIQVIVSPNEDTIVSHCDHLIAWDQSTGKERWRVSGTESGIRSVGAAYGYRPLAFGSSGKSFFTIGRDGGVIEWGIESPNPRKRFTLPRHGANANRAREVASIDVVGDGERFAIGNGNGVTVTDGSGHVIFEVNNGEPLAPAPPRPKENGRDRLDFHGAYTLVRYAPDKQHLACVFSEAPTEVRLLNAQDGKELRRVTLTDKAVRLDHSPDGLQIAVTERDGAVRLYDVQTGKLVWSYVANLNNPYENYTSDVVFSPDGTRVVAGATDNHLYVLDARDGKEVGQLIGHAWYPWTLAFSKDSQQLFSSGWDGKIRRWDMKSMQGFPLEKLEYATSVIGASPDGKWIAVAYEKGRVELVTVADGKKVASLTLGKVTASQVAFSSDSQLLAIGGSDEKQVHVSVWSIATAKELHRWEWDLGKDPHSNVEALAFSPDGRRLAAAVFRQSKAYLWDMETKNQIASLKHPEIYGLDFDTTGESVVTVGWDTHLREWDAETGELSVDLDWKIGQEDLRMYAVSCSAVGDLVATAHMNNRIKIWNRKDMTLRSEINVKESFVYGALAFSKDGLWLASGSASGRILIWDPFTGEKAMEVGKHESNAYTVCFGSDLRTLVSGGDDGMGFQWDLRRGVEKWTKEPDALWEVLRSGSAADAFGVIQALSAKPEVAVELIARKLKNVKTLADPISEPARASVYKKLIGKNDEIEYAVAARRAITAIAQTEGTDARKLLQELADRGPDDPIGQLAHAAIWGKRK
jgi:WD40 repeat protein/beta-lactamase regulating signal transducer with metallopeptidase domain